jgi:hypothetical protein
MKLDFNIVKLTKIQMKLQKIANGIDQSSENVFISRPEFYFDEEGKNDFIRIVDEFDRAIEGKFEKENE